MVILKGIYLGEASAVHDYDDNSAARRELEAIQARIRSLYDAGVPLFTREGIESLKRQLKLVEGRCGTVTVEGLDGQAIEFAVETGSVLPVAKDTEWCIEDPFIHYTTIQELTTITDMSVPRIAYCPLRIYHYNTPRRTTGHEPYCGAPPEPYGEPAELLRDCEAYLQSIMTKWETLRSVIRAADTLRPIRRVVAFACGSISWDLKDEISHSSYQHALLLSLQSLLAQERAGSDKVEFCAQDPGYTQADKSILAKHGITVLEDPDGFLQVDDSTMIISCAPQVPVKQITLELARPALMFWNIVEEPDPTTLWADGDSSRTVEVTRRYYDEYDIIKDTANFGKVALYVRRASDADIGIHPER